MGNNMEKISRTSIEYSPYSRHWCVVSNHILCTNVDTTVHQRPTCHNHHHKALSFQPYFSIFGFYNFEFDGTHSTSIGPPCLVWSVTTSCSQTSKPPRINNHQHLALNQPADTTDVSRFKSKLHVPGCTGVPEKFRFTQSLKEKLTKEHNKIPLHMFEMGTNMTIKASFTSFFHYIIESPIGQVFFSFLRAQKDANLFQ